MTGTTVAGHRQGARPLLEMLGHTLAGLSILAPPVAAWAALPPGWHTWQTALGLYLAGTAHLVVVASALRRWRP